MSLTFVVFMSGGGEVGATRRNKCNAHKDLRQEESKQGLNIIAVSHCNNQWTELYTNISSIVCCSHSNSGLTLGHMPYTDQISSNGYLAA